MADSPRLWVYKNRSYADVHQTAYGDWREFFDTYAVSRRPVPWGGSWASSKPSQKRIFLEELSIGDFILCYQTDLRAGIGIARVAGLAPRSDGENELTLEAVERFVMPVRFHELKKRAYPRLKRVAALKPGPIDTLYETSRQEAYWLLDSSNSVVAQNFK
jgi:hypothetical protein